MVTSEISYDAFLSYNPQDREVVESVAGALKDKGIRVFLDRWYLTPGVPWPTALEDALQNSRAMVVFISSSGLGAWQQREQHFGLERQVRDPGFPVIPVLLTGADPAIGFLSMNTWVDLRSGIRSEALEVLARALLGQQPGVGTTSTQTLQSPPRVFLCHAKEDAARIEAIYYYLRDEGFDPWYDKEKLVLGDHWKDEIFSAIEKTDFFAIFLSRTSARKTGFIQKEIRTAIQQYQRRPSGTTYLLPVRLEECDVPQLRLDDVTALADLHWYNLDVQDTRSLAGLGRQVWMQWDKLRELRR